MRGNNRWQLANRAVQRERSNAQAAKGRAGLEEACSLHRINVQTVVGRALQSVVHAKGRDTSRLSAIQAKCDVLPDAATFNHPAAIGHALSDA